MSGVEAARNNAAGVQQNQLLKVNPVVPAVRRSSVARPSLPTVHSGVAMDSQDFSDHLGSSSNSVIQQYQARRSSLTSSSNNPESSRRQSFELNSDGQPVIHIDPVATSTSTTSRFLSIETAIRNSIRAGRNSIRRLTMSTANNLRRVSINLEALPRMDNYRNSPFHQLDRENSSAGSRPTLEQLHESSLSSGTADSTHQLGNQRIDSTDPPEPVRDKFGWIEGVLIRNMLSIWGVMLFLRISWVVALSGIWQTLIIIGISTFITLVTALSMSAIATNGEIGGGGTYYVMSRILGPEFGGSIGIIFAIANAINASLNVVGFCQSIQDLMKNYGGAAVIVDGGDNDIRIIGTITMIAVCALCGLGAKYEAKTQGVMLVILMVALANFIAGSVMGPQDQEEKKAKGFLGYDLDLIRENWSPGYTVTDGQMQDFFSVFSVYFPAGIGILAGANVSGDLKDPNSAIPKGTILAIIITSISYAVVAIICGATMKRAATGSVEDLHNGTFLDCVHHNCTYGIYYDYQAMTLISGFGPLNYAGCFAATLSSALASYVSCPKLLQVIADDNIYPYWLVGILGKGYGKSKEPLRAYAFTFILALVFVLIAHLDVIALLISDFFLATFALMNYSTFHVSLVKPIGWRPTFKYYNMWLSLLTAVLCVVGMFLISWPVALITIAIVMFFYLVVLYRNPQVNWGSSTQAQTYREALASIQQLVYIEEHVKNYRPQILVLTGPPNSRPALLDFAHLICKRSSLLVSGNIVKVRETSKGRAITLQKSYEYLRTNKIKGFCALVHAADLEPGVAAMLEATGLGKMKPNILLLGFKGDWRSCDPISLDQYFATIHTGFDLHVAVAILRVQQGLDYSGIFADTNNGGLHRSVSALSSSASIDTLSSPEIGGIRRMNNINKTGRMTEKKMKNIYHDEAGNEVPKHIVNNVTVFRRKQGKGIIDVWWLYDDGGLTLLLPHIISTRSGWASCKLRVFCTASGQEELEKEHHLMAALLRKFRIVYSDLVVIPELSHIPKESTRIWFDGLLRHLNHRDSSQHSDAERVSLQTKTDRHLRLRELLIDHSIDSNLVVMTLPMPRKGSVSAPMYMAWLEALTADMPPFLLVRGNQTSVLTFYS